MKLSVAQEMVVIWLYWYPDLRIILPESGGRVRWSSRWQSEESRQSMKETLRLLGENWLVPEPRNGVPLTMPTPRITKQTFTALCRKSLVDIAEMHPPKNMFGGQYRYQLTDAGKKQAEILLLAKALELNLPEFFVEAIPN